LIKTREPRQIRSPPLHGTLSSAAAQRPFLAETSKIKTFSIPEPGQGADHPPRLWEAVKLTV
jgi:hypothetical protein